MSAEIIRLSDRKVAREATLAIDLRTARLVRLVRLLRLLKLAQYVPRAAAAT